MTFITDNLQSQLICYQKPLCVGSNITTLKDKDMQTGTAIIIFQGRMSFEARDYNFSK